MSPPDRDYLHGTHPEEQARLSRLNAMLNASSLRAIGLSCGERVLDVGSGLGQFARLMARAVGAEGRVVGIEADDEQLAEARRLAAVDDEADLVDFRRGDAGALPLGDDEWGTFDVAHARFVLEHVREPLPIVRAMTRAVRPRGGIVLEDENHAILRLAPEPPGVMALWQAYTRTYERQGKDPYVGRHLVSLLHRAGARPAGNDCLFFGSAAGSANLDAMVDNFVGILDGARAAMIELGLADARTIDEGLAALDRWREHPDAALWYTTAWAVGTRPRDDREAGADRTSVAAPSPSEVVRSPVAPPTEASLLRFLVEAAAELNSSLELSEVFRKVADGLRPVIDYHLFAVLLWNERTQMLENSFSMKYGQVIPQHGGFPLGYGIGGACAASGRPIRVHDVRDDPRYVRFRHPEVEIRSELAVPLVFRDQLIGVLDLESTEVGTYTEEHEQTVTALASHIATALVNARLYERVLHEEQRLERDLATARRTQRRLLPSASPVVERVEIGAAYVPALELGGDFYDLRRHPDGRMSVAVGDVSGKGTPAALLASMTVGLLRGQTADRAFDPPRVLAELNDGLHAVGFDNRFVAMSFAVFDPSARRLDVANGGFPRPLHVREGGVAVVPARGRPVGMFPGTRYVTSSLAVRSDDLVVFCSDGVLESESPRGEPFEATRMVVELARLRSATAQGIADGLARAAAEFAGGQLAQSDDHTIVALKFR